MRQQGGEAGQSILIHRSENPSEHEFPTGLTVRELERSIRSQVEQQVRALSTARRSVELADANHRLAEETLRAEEALAEVGRAIQKDVLEARTEVARTRAEAAKARTDYRLAQTELLRLQGQL